MRTNSSITPFQIFVLILTPIGIAGSSLLPLQDTGTISNTIFGSVLLTPANYVFAIWALIYGGLLALAVAQLLPTGRDNPRYAKARVPLLVNASINFAWLVAWGSLLTPLSLLLIVGQLLSAIWIFLSLEVHISKPVTTLEAFIRFASGAYVAWLTLATVLNAACVLVFYKWNGWGLSDSVWTVIMMIVAATVGLLEVRTWRSLALSFVFTWAFAGIALRPNQPMIVVITAALLGMLFLIVLISNFKLPSQNTRLKGA
jgi:hypothetical protein